MNRKDNPELGEQLFVTFYECSSTLVRRKDHDVNLEDADNGVRHIRRLLALAESLRALGASVYHHEWHELAMGSWSLTGGTRHCSYLFTWDGRDGVISVQGPFHAGQGSGSRSPSIASEQLGVPPSVDPFHYVERFFEPRRNA